MIRDVSDSPCDTMIPVESTEFCHLSMIFQGE
jgi:hypothetical protein